MGVYEKMYRVTVAEAAARLGVKEQAIRKRIQRGTLAHDKDEDGRVYVYLDPQDGATSTSIDTGMDKLLQSLQEQIAYLRQEAEDWKEEARRRPRRARPRVTHGGSRSPHSDARGGGSSSGWSDARGRCPHDYARRCSPVDA